MTDPASTTIRLEEIAAALRLGPDGTVKEVVRDGAGRIDGVRESRPPFDLPALFAEGSELFVRLGGLSLRGDGALRAVKTQAAFAVASLPYFAEGDRRRITEAVERAEQDWRVALR